MKASQLAQPAWALGLCLMVSQSYAQSFNEVVKSALLMYPSITASKAKTEAALADVDRARAAHYPQINYGLARNSYANGELPSTIEANAKSPSIKLNLWSGGRIEADARRSQALTVGSQFQELGTQDDVAALAAEAYINWARSMALFDIAAKNLSAHQVTLDDISKIVSIDAGRRIDYEQAKVRLDNAALAKIQRQAELAQARQRLSRFWTGPLPTAPKGLQEAVRPDGTLGRVPQTLEDALAAVSDDLPSIAQQKAQVKAAEAAVSMARGQYWPTVDATAARQLNVSSGQQDTFTQVQLNMPLYNGGATSAQVSTAVKQLQASQATLEEAQLLAKERIGFAFQDWLSAKGRADQGAAQAKVGEQVVEGYRLQFRLARRQLLDLLNIQAESFNYQTAATSAFYDEQVMRARLLAATGELAKRFTP
jgi:adhesin transport system outer membrane protein